MNIGLKLSQADMMKLHLKFRKKKDYGINAQNTYSYGWCDNNCDYYYKVVVGRLHKVYFFRKSLHDLWSLTEIKKT